MAFKMTGKSPMMKKLIGKQKNLPAELKAKIMAAPESPAKMYGKSPAKNYKNPQDYKVFNMGNEPTPMKQVKPTGKDLDKYSDYEKYDEDGKKITRKQKREIKKEFKAAKKAGAPGTKRTPKPHEGKHAELKKTRYAGPTKADRVTELRKKENEEYQATKKKKSPAKQSMKDRAKNVVNKAKNVGSKVVNAMAAPGDPRLRTDRKTDHGKKKSPAKQKSEAREMAKKRAKGLKQMKQMNQMKPLDQSKMPKMPKELKDHKVPVARMGGARVKRKK